MNLVLNLCDHIEVLDFGRVIASGTPAEIRGSAPVADAYLGSTHAAASVGAVEPA
jgi:ABC-type branched-subunit amino acid transport system ATPase component